MDGVGGLLVLLQEEPLRHQALRGLHQACDSNWSEIFSQLDIILDIIDANPSPEVSELASSIASKCYYYREKYDDALLYALKSGNLLNLEAGGDYETQIVAKALDTYIALNSADSAEFDDENDVGLEVFRVGELRNRLDDIISGLFQSCLQKGSFKEAIGIAIEARQVDKVMMIVEKCGENVDELTDFCLQGALNLVDGEEFRSQLLEALVTVLEERNSYLQLFLCLYSLNDFKKFAATLYRLLDSPDENTKLIAFQAAFDLLELQDQKFLANILDMIKPDETDPPLRLLRHILSTNSTRDIHAAMLKSKRKSDIGVFRKIKDVFKGHGAKSVLRNGALLSYAFMQCGTNMKPFLTRDEGKDFVKASNNWARFSAAAIYGVIHKGDSSNSLDVLRVFLPRPDLTEKTRAGPFSDGGGLYALGLLHQNEGSSTEKGKLVMNYLTTVLVDAIALRETTAGRNDQSAGPIAMKPWEPFIHGAATGLGLVACGLGVNARSKPIPHDWFLAPTAAVPEQNDDLGSVSVVEHLMKAVMLDEAVASESAAYAIGLILMGTNEVGLEHEIISDLWRKAQGGTEHERVIRACSMAIALSLFNSGSKLAANAAIESMIQHDDGVIRYSGMFALGLCYVASSDAATIRRLLRIAVSDVNNDVRRAAVMNLGLVCLNEPARVPQLISLLAESYNPHVRYGAAMALGISGSNLANDSAAMTTLLEILHKLSEDKVDYVRQGALISLGMALAGCNWDVPNSQAKKLFEKYSETLKSDKANPMTKLGAILGMGILEQGGRNSAIELVNSSLSSLKGASTFSANNLVRGPAIAGMVMFLQYWFWYPYMHMLSLSFSPQLLVGVSISSDFKKILIPSDFSVELDVDNKDLIKFDYPAKIKNKKAEQRVKIQTVALSMTNKLSATKKAKENDMEVEEAPPTTPAESNSENAEDPEARRGEILANPIRVNKSQQKHVAFKDDNSVAFAPVTADQMHKKGVLVLVSKSKATSAENQQIVVDIDPTPPPAAAPAATTTSTTPAAGTTDAAQQ